MHGFLSSAVALLAMTLASGLMLAYKGDMPIRIGSVVLSLHTAAIPIATLFSNLAIIYFFIAVRHVAYAEPPTDRQISSILVPFFALWIINVCPYNWFGIDKPADAPSIRVFSNLLFLAIYAIALSQIISWLIKRIRVETEPLKKKRLEFLLLAFTLFLGFLVCYVLEAAIDVGPYSYLMATAFGFLITSLSLLYLSIVSPEFFTRFLRKRLGCAS